jgi:hypothetical protein
MKMLNAKTAKAHKDSKKDLIERDKFDLIFFCLFSDKK